MCCKTRRVKVLWAVWNRWESLIKGNRYGEATEFWKNSGWARNSKVLQISLEFLWLRNRRQRCSSLMATMKWWMETHIQRIELTLLARRALVLAREIRETIWIIRLSPFCKFKNHLGPIIRTRRLLGLQSIGEASKSSLALFTISSHKQWNRVTTLQVWQQPKRAWSSPKVAKVAPLQAVASTLQTDGWLNLSTQNKDCATEMN